MSAFDPHKTPDTSDIAGRGTRLATVASVLSMMLAEPLSGGLRENLNNPELLDVWPLRDADSLSGISLLRDAADTPKSLADEWLELFGYGGRVPVNSPNAAVSRMAKDAVASPAVRQLPATHLAVGMALCGAAAARASSEWRNSNRAGIVHQGEAISEILDSGLESAAHVCEEALESTAHAQTFHALPLLIRGFVGELRSFANECRSLV
ncbi:MAG: hypothetical protein LKJ57_05160 [Ancrocorticia sp.]|jgi:hypothetical protein|nr:hypothetical protein [Ancrocorticia sp.]MCI1964048.1 hypothetical protein [Ancrocorticia sp.]MCI2001732.1 hypothetical protein [Ancrocorticia sp.]MCI2012972.1 hypothetical protein [Ancrocorticia sp.]MCI2029751.1 hypothetical protein [Ancrocorticia sp.]